MSGLRTRGQCFALGVFATAVSGAGAAGLVHLTGEVLSSISLVFGLLFFVFAARYYVAILAVLVAPGANGMNGKNGAEPPNGNMGGTAYPMISVHLPLYNEERVVDRLLTACTNLDYPNYEVVVVDDSTDGTVKILKEWILKQLETTIPRVKIVHRTKRAGFK